MPRMQTAPPCIVCNDEHRFLVLDQLREIKRRAVGGCCSSRRAATPRRPMTLAALQAARRRRRPGARRHAGRPDGGRRRRVRHARCGARCSAPQPAAIVVLGITPDSARNRLRLHPRRCRTGRRRAAAVVAPLRRETRPATAARYLAEGGYYWNSGMFVVARLGLARRRSQALPARHRRSDARSLGRAQGRPAASCARAAPSFPRYRASRSTTRCMERCPAARFPLHMVPLDAGWSDLGAWDAVWQVGERDAQGNASSAMRCCTTAATRWCMRPAGWSAWSGSTT